MYLQNATIEQLKSKLGRGRAKKGMFEGDLIEGELEIGQVSAQIEQVIPANSIIKEFIKSTSFENKCNCLNSLDNSIVTKDKFRSIEFKEKMKNILI